MIILAILTMLGNKPDDQAKPSTPEKPTARNELAAPRAPERMCKDVLGQVVKCNPY